MRICIHMDTYICIYIYMYMFEYIYIYMYIYKYIYIYIYLRTRMHLHSEHAALKWLGIRSLTTPTSTGGGGRCAPQRGGAVKAGEYTCK